MSQEKDTGRKEKRARRDAERQSQKQKGKKRKRADVGEQQESREEDELKSDFIPLESVANDASRGALDDAEPPAPAPSKKRRMKAKHEDAPTDNTVAQANGKHRFILFIGNLPYSTTDATLQSHFSNIKPFTLRHRTDPKTKKSKGFAFLEFENYDRMKTCLKLYHHSIFDPAKVDVQTHDEPKKEVKKSKGGRRINVELTAGGGGKADARKEKIKAKNVRLDEQRKRRAELERVEREKEGKKEAAESSVKESKKKNHSYGDAEAGVGSESIHPSRLARIKT